MKLKHRQTLDFYQKYGEVANFFPKVTTSKNITRIGQTVATRPLERPSKVEVHQLHQTYLNKHFPKLLLCGDSIINGLNRYHEISSCFARLDSFNIGIGGDRTEHALWRMSDLTLPSSIEAVLIHCGTNNILNNSSSLQDTADDILSIGIMAKQKLPNAKIIISHIHFFENSGGNSDLLFAYVKKVNSILQWKSKKSGFSFIPTEDGWTIEGKAKVNKKLYHEDLIHFNLKGNRKFFESILSSLNKMTFSRKFANSINNICPFLSEETDVIKKMEQSIQYTPENYVPSYKKNYHHHPPLPRYTEVPKDVYDHEKMLNLSYPAFSRKKVIPKCKNVKKHPSPTGLPSPPMASKPEDVTMTPPPPPIASTKLEDVTPKSFFLFNFVLMIVSNLAEFWKLFRASGTQKKKRLKLYGKKLKKYGVVKLFFEVNVTIIFFGCMLIIFSFLLTSNSLHQSDYNHSFCSLELRKYLSITDEYFLDNNDMLGIFQNSNLISLQRAIKCFIFMIFFVAHVFCKGIKKAKLKHSSLMENRYFIRKHKFIRIKNEKTKFYFILLILYINREERIIELPSDDDFFTTDLLSFSELTYESNLKYVSLYFYCSSESNCSFSRGSRNYLILILLLSGDIETHPGPIAFNYQINNPELCGYYRTAIFSVISGINLVTNVDESVSLGDNLNEMKVIFGNQFNVNELDENKLRKLKSKIVKYNSDWGRNRLRDNKKEYYEYFSTKNWLSLSDKIKRKHSLHCKKCPVSCYESFSKYPSVYEKFVTDNEIILQFAENVLNSKKKSVTDCKVLTKNIVSVLDNSFSEYFGLSFQDSYQKCFSVIPKKSPNERRNEKRKVIRDAFSSVQKGYDNTAVDRLFGTRTSGSSWDFQRKQQSFETVPNCLKRTAEKQLDIQSGLKKPKNHVGNFDYYDIDKESLTAEAISWTEETNVVWKHLGDRYIKLKDDKSKSIGNAGQIVEQYLLYQESLGEDLSFTHSKKNLPKKVTSRRCLLQASDGCSAPKNPLSSKVRKMKKDEENIGLLDIGESIVEKEFKELVTNNLGIVETHTFSVYGKNIPCQSFGLHFLKNIRSI